MRNPALFLLLTPLLALGLASCVSSGPGSAPFFQDDPGPNLEVRGSRAFCERYGRQTAQSRLQAGGSDGRGPSGFDRSRARKEGERATARCLAGRTN